MFQLNFHSILMKSNTYKLRNLEILHTEIEIFFLFLLVLKYSDGFF